MSHYVKLTIVHKYVAFFYFIFRKIGTGSQMQLYDLEAGNMMRSFHVFDGIRVHGICCCSIDSIKEPLLSSKLDFKIAVFGERRVKLFSLQIENVAGTQDRSEVEVYLNLSCLLPKFSHWVLDVCFLLVIFSNYTFYYRMF